MPHVDKWFHEQLVRIKDRHPRHTSPTGRRFGPVLRADTMVRAAWAEHGPMVLGSCALLAVTGLLLSEAMHGPLQADQPFGLSAPPAVFRAASMPSVNGHAAVAAAEDRNTVVMSGPRH